MFKWAVPYYLGDVTGRWAEARLGVRRPGGRVCERSQRAMRGLIRFRRRFCDRDDGSLATDTITGTSGQAQYAGDLVSDGSSARFSRSSEESNAARSSREWSSDHPVNIRLRIPLLFSRFYVTLMMGRERRSPQRRARDAMQHPLQTKGNVTFLLVAGTIVGIALFTIVQAVGVWVLSQTGWVLS